MGAFSTSMRLTSLRLITKLGSPCVMTKVTAGQYNPSTGKTNQALEEFDTFSAPSKTMSSQFSTDGMNTNLAGFMDQTLDIPWFGEEIDKTWLYNDSNIVSVKSTEAQGEIILYTIVVVTD